VKRFRGTRATLSPLRSRYRLSRLRNGRDRAGHRGRRNRGSLTLAECLCRAADRLHSSRMPRSCSAPVAAYLARVRGLLLAMTDAPLARQGCTRSATGRIANRRRHRGDPPGRGSPPPLRTPHRVEIPSPDRSGSSKRPGTNDAWPSAVAESDSLTIVRVESRVPFGQEFAVRHVCNDPAARQACRRSFGRDSNACSRGRCMMAT
jgi:hypothetical protein